jgi:hypothetical protein
MTYCSMRCTVAHRALQTYERCEKCEMDRVQQLDHGGNDHSIYHGLVALETQFLTRDSDARRR